MNIAVSSLYMLRVGLGLVQRGHAQTYTVVSKPLLYSADAEHYNQAFIHLKFHSDRVLLLAHVLIKIKRRKNSRASLRQEFLVTPTSETEPKLVLYCETGVNSWDRHAIVSTLTCASKRHQ